MRLNPSYLIAGAIALALGGWLASGQLGANMAPDDPLPAIEAEREPPLMSVRVRDSLAAPVEREIVLNGTTAPARTVEVRAETKGRVVGLGARRGELVDAGEVLVRLDVREREARIAQAEALVRQRELEFEAATRLGEKGFQAETKVAEAGAALEAARAALEQVRIDLEHTVIRAPFAGVLERRPVEIGDYVDIADPVALVIEQDPFLVIGDVAEREVAHIRTGMTGHASLVTGEDVTGTIRYVGSQADPATRTFPVELEVSNPDQRFTAGVSAELRISYQEMPAHQVASSLLALDDDGRLGVKAVDGDDQVVFLPADIVRADGDWVWLAGLPERLRLITVGQGFVRAGEQVKPVPEDGNARRGAPLVAERRA